MLEELRTHLQQELRIPDIVGERCVHAHIEQASCHACVDSCPRQAWQLTDDSLGIDAAACDGCGLCAPVCPQGAILHDHEPAFRQLNQHFIALVACEQADIKPQAGVITCLHALGLHDVLKLYHQGIRGLVIAQGNCETCARHPQATLQQAVEKVNISLKQRQQPTLVLRQLAASAWLEQYQQTQPPQSTEAIDRRHFLRQGLRQVVTEGLKLQGLLPQDRERFSPPATLLPATDNPSDLPYVPQINITRCDGCDTCFKICPHEALLFDPEAYHYVMVPEQCTGCQLCVDTCEKQAISIHNWITPQNNRLPLQQDRCRYCGVRFHRPIERVSEQACCHICYRVNHYRNLYQVMK